ncbi:MAG TPA: hypothetical protein VK727_06180 [Steroidobacteraceae bacterium]|nr:hypothetical protein [Steroidobacteraceae bacterium]
MRRNAAPERATNCRTAAQSVRCITIALHHAFQLREIHGGFPIPVMRKTDCCCAQVGGDFELKIVLYGHPRGRRSRAHVLLKI